jgi:putative component of membrane protein insertase Oxa1/YidC/SpoIIIJ protein YidD
VLSYQEEPPKGKKGLTVPLRRVGDCHPFSESGDKPDALLFRKNREKRA